MTDSTTAPTGPQDPHGGPVMHFRKMSEIRHTRKKVEWLIRDFWLTDGFGVVGGAEKSLKSWLMLSAAVSIASGKPLFGDSHFGVPERRRVAVLSGEGGVALTLDRIEHLCRAFGVSPEDIEDWLLISDNISSTDDQQFRDDMTVMLSVFDPGLVILDPAYVYMTGAADQAGNVLKMGALLSRFRVLCGDRAVMVGHHFTKTGRDDLTLSSLTQAGFREHVDHWLLVGHRAFPDLENQVFQLQASMGARRGFAWTANIDVSLGRFDSSTLQHEGSPRFHVVRGVALSSGPKKKRPTTQRDEVLLYLNIERARSAASGKSRADIQADLLATGAMKQGEPTTTRNNTLKLLRGLVADGVVAKAGDDGNPVYYLPGDAPEQMTTEVYQ